MKETAYSPGQLHPGESLSKVKNLMTTLLNTASTLVNNNSLPCSDELQEHFIGFVTARTFKLDDCSITDRACMRLDSRSVASDSWRAANSHLPFAVVWAALCITVYITN